MIPSTGSSLLTLPFPPPQVILYVSPALTTAGTELKAMRAPVCATTALSSEMLARRRDWSMFSMVTFGNLALLENIDVERSDVESRIDLETTEAQTREHCTNEPNCWTRSAVRRRAKKEGRIVLTSPSAQRPCCDRSSTFLRSRGKPREYNVGSASAIFILLCWIKC